MERKCKICGCTDTNACEGGCYWVAEELCSKCADNLIKQNQQLQQENKQLTEVNKEQKELLNK